MKHAVFVKSADIKVKSFGRFLHVSNTRTSSIQLFAEKSVRGERIMSKTDILNEITRRRNDMIEQHLENPETVDAISVYANLRTTVYGRKKNRKKSALKKSKNVKKLISSKSKN